MLIRIAAATLLSLAALPALVQSTVSQADAQQAATEGEQAFVAAYNAGKPADVAALFTEDGVYLTPGRTMLTDHQTMTAALARRQQAGWTQETVKVLAVHPEGSDVLDIVHDEVQGTGAQAGKQISGYAANLLTREGGSWRIKLLAANLTPQHDVTGMKAATAH